METLEIHTTRREELVRLTGALQDLVTAQGWHSGALLVFCPHTTAGLTINENADPDVVRDLIMALARLVPQHADFRHAEGNSDAHVKASLMGPSLTCIVEGGRIQLGTWQGLYLCEWDGPRNRSVWVQWLGSA